MPTRGTLEEVEQRQRLRLVSFYSFGLGAIGIGWIVVYLVYAALSDGAQVFVPVVGQVGGPGPGPSAGGGGGLVNLNTASPEALEALPGIGPVTVQKIVAARQERPFATLEELVERQVMNRGQLEDIRDLVTL